jgi:hypothetical protein
VTKARLIYLAAIVCLLALFLAQGAGFNDGGPL